MINKILFKLFGLRLISSQGGEDLIIESLLPFKRDGFYVDIGANHPIRYSNTLLFKNKGWQGINIEPNPERMRLFKLLRRRDINLNIGIGPAAATLDFYVFNEHTLSTFDSRSAEEFQKIGHQVKKIIKVPVAPLKDILEKYCPDREIDLFSIDTEGYDLEVLKSNDWHKFRPRFIILETLEYRQNGEEKKLNDIFDPFLAAVGYKSIADTYINTIYEKIN